MFMTIDLDEVTRIKKLLRHQPKGLTISEIARRLSLNRNVVGKYLEILLVSGDVEMRQFGPAKVYSLSQRVPIAAMLSFHDDFVLVLDERGTIIQINDPFAVFLERERESVLGVTLENSDLPMVSDHEVVAATKGITPAREFMRIARGGEQGGDRYFRLRVIPTVFEGGQEGSTIILEDVTDKKRYEQQLKESEARYRAVVEDQTELICRFRPDCTLTFVNRAFAEFFDTTSQGAVGQSLLPFFAQDDQPWVRADIAILSPMRSTVHRDVRAVARSQNNQENARWIAWTIHGIFGENGTLIEIQGSGRDITHEKDLENMGRKYLGNIEFLSQTAMEFVDLPPEKDIYQLIGMRLHDLVPRALVLVSSIDNVAHLFRLRSVEGREEREILHRILGREPVGMTLDTNQYSMQNLIENKQLHRFPYDLYTLGFGQVPQQICTEITEKFDLGTIYVAALMGEGGIYGSVSILLPQDASLSDVCLLNSFIQQASIALGRRVAETALRQSEEKCRALAENALDGIVILDFEGKILDANRTAADLLGYQSLGPSIGRSIFEFLAPSSKSDALSALKEVEDGTMTGKPNYYQVLRPSGEKIWIETLSKRIAYTNQMADIVTFRDITERRKGDALRARLATIVESSSDAIVGMTTDGIIASWNRAAEHIFGIDADTACGRSICSFLLLDRGDLGELLNTLRGGCSIPPFETKGLSRDGTPIELSVAFSAVICGGEDVKGVSAIIRDITLSKERSRDLAVKSAVLETFPHALLLIDARSRITFVNQAGAALWGYADPEGMIGISIEDFARNREAPGLLGPVRNAFIQKAPSESEVSARRVDGTPIRILVAAQLVRDVLSIPLCLTLTCHETPVLDACLPSGRHSRTGR